MRYHASFMALPVAHLAVALGASRRRSKSDLLLLVILALAADFDFALVWGLGLPLDVYHRTFSHSLTAAVAVTGLYGWLRARIAAFELSPFLVFCVYLSHPLLDLLCTADAADHGVMLLWPLSTERFGWAVLVPLYQQFAVSPFSLQGALRFTLLEVLLAVPLWASVAWLRRCIRAAERPPWAPEV